MALIYNATFDKNTRNLSFEDKAGNEIYSFVVPERGPAVDNIRKPLTFKATQDGSTVTLTKNGSPVSEFQTSRDGGNTWTDYTIGTAITLNTGDKVSFRAKSDRTSAQSDQNYFHFLMEGEIEARHNVMSMYRTNDFATYESVVEFAFYNLFQGCPSLTKAPSLPATTLAGGCYYSMFNGCPSLTKAPELPATTLATSCYNSMFNGCISLAEAPVLPATTLADNCYNQMFSNCTSLTKTPELPVTTLADGCYSFMFWGCTSLVNAPVLPATTLAGSCYYSMFKGCASLTKAPELPATTLTFSCYGSMFQGCSSLVNAPALPATTLASYCYDSMFSGCTSLVNAPALPATTLNPECYQNMFHDCTSLAEAPELPATTLAEGCYSNMFFGCTSLAEAPALPATTLAEICYNGMFKVCTSLTKAPELPATTLADGCYSNMFYNCSSLNEVRCKMPSSFSEGDISSYTSWWLDGVSSTGTFYTNADAKWPSGADGIPEGWTRVNEVAKDDITKPLTFRATQDGSTVALRKNGSPTGDFQTSTDGGNTWEDYTLGTAITLNTSDGVSFRAKADRTSGQSDKNYLSFTMTGKIEAWHNVMSLYRTSDFATFKNVVGYAFSGLFRGCTSLTKAPVLPATTLSRGCYSSMFDGCTSLTEAPSLPATSLDNTCYLSMFSGCTSLTKAPILPATTLSIACYSDMFNGCTSLTEAPALPATTLANSCYKSMFQGCTSLAESPALPATTLSNYCYQHMFQGCTSLTKAHEFTATALANYCYYDMFNGCTSLTKAPALPVTTLAEGCYGEMFSGCTSLSEAPKLPATTLITACYLEMFSGCTSLTKAPELPSTKLARGCYQRMFKGCTSLTKAPALPATTLDENCYVEMFSGCSNLNEVRCKIPSSYSSSDISSTYTASWLYNVSSTGTFYTNADANWPSGVSGIPTGWQRVNEEAKDDVTKPLTFKATQDGSTVKLTQSGSPSGYFQTSTDGGTNWVDYTINDVIRLNIGDEVSFRVKSIRTSAQSDRNYFYFEMTGKIEAWHNVMSLYRTSDFAKHFPASYAFYSLFYGCTSLTKAPVLSTTRLATDCYAYMFFRCTSLTKAPELPATTLTNHCYMSMFSGCQSLKEVRIAATKTASRSLEEWLYDVSATGDLYCDPNATIFPTDSASGIPANWTRHALADYPSTP